MTAMKGLFILYQRCILTSVLMVLCFTLAAQNRSAFKARAVENQSRQLRSTLTTSDTISLEGMGTIYSLSIDATINQPREASFTRIVLEDKDGHDYLVAESDWFRNDTTTVTLEHFCEETALLDGIVPLRLKCYLAGEATMTLNGIHASNQPVTRKTGEDAETEQSVKKSQVKDIVDRINAYNRKHGKIWRAGVTDYALQYYYQREPLSEAKSESGSRRHDTYIANLIYYVDGIYEMGERKNRSQLSPQQSPYVSSFSWANRHGCNWMTPTKDQLNSNWCVLFATCSAIEALVNLQFNQHLNLDLSEKDLAYNYNLTYGHAALWNKDGMIVAKDYGIVNDDGAPLDTVYQSRPAGNELIQFSSFLTYKPGINGMEGVKGILLQYGPCVSGTLSHTMALVGWGKVTLDSLYTISDYHDYNCQADSSLIGLDYWIFKDSHYQAPDPYLGPIYGDCPGYLHIIFNNPIFFDNLHYVNSIITSLNYSAEDVVCEDLDNDGFFNWGIGQKPNHCPAWAPNEADGDESNATLGPMDEYGYCEELSPNHPVYEYIQNDSILTSPANRTSFLGIMYGATVTIQAQQTFNNGTKLLLDKGTTLIIDATTINGSSIQPYAGSKIILNNDGKILKPFNVPIGVELIINSGSIE